MNNIQNFLIGPSLMLLPLSLVGYLISEHSSSVKEERETTKQLQANVKVVDMSFSNRSAFASIEFNIENKFNKRFNVAKHCIIKQFRLDGEYEIPLIEYQYKKMYYYKLPDNICTTKITVLQE